MNRKSTVVQEAEEIIENYIRKQESLSRKFQIKSRRKHHGGFFLLLGVGITVLLGILLFLLF